MPAHLIVLNLAILKRGDCFVAAKPVRMDWHFQVCTTDEKRSGRPCTSTDEQVRRLILDNKWLTIDERQVNSRLVTVLPMKSSIKNSTT
jgi:hypothetical protein